MSYALKGCPVIDDREEMELTLREAETMALLKRNAVFYLRNLVTDSQTLSLMTLKYNYNILLLYR